MAKTSLNDIAKEAGVTRPTVYSYFSSRDEVVAAALLQLAMAFGQRLLTHMQQYDNWRERYRQSVIMAIAELSQAPFSLMINQGDLSAYVSEDALKNEQGWRLVRMLFQQIFLGCALTQDRLDDLAEATSRLVLSELMVKGPIERTGPQQELFLSKLCDGILHAFIGSEESGTDK